MVVLLAALGTESDQVIALMIHPEVSRGHTSLAEIPPVCRTLHRFIVPCCAMSGLDSLTRPFELLFSRACRSLQKLFPYKLLPLLLRSRRHRIHPAAHNSYGPTSGVDSVPLGESTTTSSNSDRSSNSQGASTPMIGRSCGPVACFRRSNWSA